MRPIKDASITGHTTASSLRPHVLYVVDVASIDSKKYTLLERYSEVRSILYHLQLSRMIGLTSTSVQCPARRAWVYPWYTTSQEDSGHNLPSAWVDDRLIEERKAGLNAYLKAVLRDIRWRTHSALVDFFVPSSIGALGKFNLEDALPSTVSRKGAEAIMAAASLTAPAYYPDWSVNSNPPESIDYSEFDLLYFGDPYTHLRLHVQLIPSDNSFCDTKLFIGNILGCRWAGHTAATG
jgi:chitinase